MDREKWRKHWQEQYGTTEYRLYRTANRYGMRIPELLDMLHLQGFRCKICNHTLDATTLKVDHNPECCDHSSKRNTCGKCTRGLLCHRCNLAVGHMENMLYDGIYDSVMYYLQPKKTVVIDDDCRCDEVDGVHENHCPALRSWHAKNDPDYDHNKKLRD